MANIYVNTAGSNTSPFDTWAKAATTLGAGLGVATNADTIWVKNTHSEVAAASTTETCPTAPGLRILTTSDATEPPTSITTGAKVRTSGTNSLAVDGFAYIYGIEFVAGEGSSGGPAVSIASTGASVAHGLVLDACKCTIAATGASATINLGRSGASTIRDQAVEMINPVFKFGAAGQSVQLRGGRVRVVGATLDAAGSTPTTLLKTAASCDGDTLIECSDLSGRAFTNLVNWGTNCQANIDVRNCKLPASIVVATGTHPGPGGAVVRMHNCDSGNTNYRFSEQRYEGGLTDEHTLVKSGGASDAVTANSFKMVSSASALFQHPLKSPEFVQKVTSTGSPVTCTVDILHDSLTALKDNEAWLEIIGMADSGSPLGTLGSDRASDILSAGAAQPSSAATWTTTGMTNPNKQKLEVTGTLQQKGYVICRVCLAKPNYTIYADNKPSLA